MPSLVRFNWTDDDGSGLTGTIINNAQLQLIFDAVDAALAGIVSLADAYPIGSIYTNAVSPTNPATLLGFGTWVAFGAGRVMVGLDAGQPEFDTIGETGGANTHTLTIAEMPAHSHDIKGGVAAGAFTKVGESTDQSNTDTTAIQSEGGSGAHNNLQPYVVVYMWRRTA